MVNGNRHLKREARKLQEERGLSYTQAREEVLAREAVLTIGERGGVKMQVTMEGGLGNYHPYLPQDNPVLAQIEMQDGTVVIACDFGCQGTFTFSDGEEATSWVWPMLDVNDEGDASHLITGEQHAALEEAEDFAQTFFSGDLDMSREQVEGLTATQVLALVRERASHR